eukprot:CAMPEP_0197446700 /NCGR_PEP_ID=MMETSP1175-20131217/11580_1 /TAXON_ID=1003142 /ORGANISM="Triceratium dubium, Strain CCMP147" /LENGTH=276 /DNA_ID=CAMNT_0042977851 /DNA_START=162 /DNA_END=992 /DNA_ORIENTATION=-
MARTRTSRGGKKGPPKSRGKSDIGAKSRAETKGMKNNPKGMKNNPKKAHLAGPEQAKATRGKASAKASGKTDVEPKMSPAKGHRAKAKFMKDGSGWDIRFGSLEVVAVYGGDEDDDNDSVSAPLRYSFARLCDDVLRGHGDDDLARVEWYVPLDEGRKKRSKAGSLFILASEDGPEPIAIGSIVCSVTGKILERADDTIEVSPKVRSFVDCILDRQLADDYDPEKEGEDGPGYEARLKRRKVREAPVYTKYAEADGKEEEEGNVPPASPFWSSFWQ